MSDPAYNLQQAVYTALNGFTNAGANVFHRVPQQQPLPFLQIGDDVITSDFENGEFYDCEVIVNVLASTKPQVKLIAGQVKAALDLSLSVIGYQTAEWWHVQTRYSTEADGTTERAIVEFRYLLQAE